MTLKEKRLEGLSRPGLETATLQPTTKYLAIRKPIFYAAAVDAARNYILLLAQRLGKTKLFCSIKSDFDS